MCVLTVSGQNPYCMDYSQKQLWRKMTAKFVENALSWLQNPPKLEKCLQVSDSPLHIDWNIQWFGIRALFPRTGPSLVQNRPRGFKHCSGRYYTIKSRATGVEDDLLCYPNRIKVTDDFLVELDTDDWMMRRLPVYVYRVGIAVVFFSSWFSSIKWKT